MVIRVTNQMISNLTLRNANTAMLNMYKIQNQIASGQKFSNAVENPNDASQVIKMNTSLGQLADWKTNITTAKEELNLAYDTLGGVQENLQRINELTIQLASGIHSDSGNLAIISEINERAKTIAGLANTQYLGTYIFGGTNTLNNPYDVDDNMNVTHNGTVDGEVWERRVEINFNEEVTLNVNGKDIFGDDTGGIFAIVKNLNDILAIDPVDRMAISQSLKPIQDVMGKVTDATSLVSSRVSRLESVSDLNTTMTTTYKTLKADLFETDVIEATSQFALWQTAMEATFKVGSWMLNGPSLLNYI